MNRFHLYCSYYTPKSLERLEEIHLCLRKNQDISEIEKIYLMIDDKSAPPAFINNKVEILEVDSRPTYARWLQLSERLSQGRISILVNSDIYLDSSISLLSEIINAGSLHSFVALSRYELTEGKRTLHANPKWSQDTWAFKVHGIINRSLLQACNFNLGIPRCDNKIAAVFSEHGYQIFNPCNFIHSYHVHKSKEREYNLLNDVRIMGSTVWVEPSESLTAPSSLHLDYWTLNDKQICSHKINNTFSELHGTSSLSSTLLEQSLIVAHDKDWQYPAITEKHAYECMLHTFRCDKNFQMVKYLAFPWATLIDQLKTRSSARNPAILTSSLKRLKRQLHGATKIITVCQHIRMLEFQHIFAEMNVTDVFWSHATKGLKHFPNHNDINIHPFPLYAAQCSSGQIEENNNREFLFSFVGAKSAPFYLTRSRDIIVENFSNLENAFVKGRDAWHYNKIVYDYQIKGSADNLTDLVNRDKTLEFVDSMKRSIFSLCPSGSGPNSIRLWESIGLGSIPVIMADTLALPGDQLLWEQACFFCNETEADIKKLPDLLKELANNSRLITDKRHLLKQIWSIYGNGSFVSDIKELIISFVNDRCILFKEKSDHCSIKPIDSTVNDAKDIRLASKNSRLDFMLTSLSSLNSFVLLCPDKARSYIKSNYSLVANAYFNADRNSKAIFIRLNSLKRLETSFWKHDQA